MNTSFEAIFMKS